MAHLLSAIIMVGGAGLSPQEQLVLAAQRASAIDLINTLRAQGVAQIVLAAPSTEWLPPGLEVIHDDDLQSEPFHFGVRLASLIERYDMHAVLYFGGGSAPLIDQSVCGMIIGLLERASTPGGSAIPSHIVLTNNLHSSDWAAISRIDEALPVIRQVNRDNSLAWLLKESGEYDVRVLSGVRPATSMDIDTPTDLAIIARHADLQPALRAVILGGPLDRIPVDRVLGVASRVGSTLALMGRVSPLALQHFNKTSQCWTRVVSEERGMIASGRFDSGQVRSILSPWLKARGFAGFFADLADLAEAAIFDNRVLFAAQAVYPDAADRFASDLFWIDQVRDPWVRDFTAAAAEASIPIVMGGHSVVAGGLYALCEIIQRGAMPF